jgi:hypothetical protein
VTKEKLDRCEGHKVSAFFVLMFGIYHSLLQRLKLKGEANKKAFKN